ncbi:S9 family peptidase [Porphyromonas levii]|uniref:S9 family peptidase n=1 Tax=Porphyromonas levii TaxID=28114 RepID=UPI000362DF33|nr:S9 family peptidase [Porphyromonas levii]
MKKISSLVVVLFALLTSVPSWAEGISLKDITYGVYAARSAGNSFRPMADGNSYTVVSDDGTRLVQYSYESGKEVAVLFDTKTARDCSFDTFEDYIISDTGHHIIILRDGKSIYRRSATYDAYHYDVRRNRVEPLTSPGARVRVPLLSPDGRNCAFVVDNNIYVKKFDFDTEVQVTTDGKQNEILNGVTDWVYEEELYLTSLMSWSADSKYLAFVRTDESQVKSYDMTVYGKGNYPDIYSFKYPKAGEKNSEVSVCLYHLDNRKTSVLDLGMKEEFYIPRMTFHKEHLYVFTLNRLQNHLRTYQINPDSQVARLWLEDQDDRYIDSNSWVLQLAFTNDGAYYVSETSGRPQLYRLDQAGVRQQQLTKGDYDIDTFYGVTPSGEVVYSMAYPTPMDRTIVAQDKKGRTRYLSPEKGWSTATFSSNLSYYLLKHSSATELPKYEIYRTRDAKALTLLEDNNALAQRLAQVKYNHREFIQVNTKSGQTLNAWMIKPEGFDAHKKYPVVMTQYSGPGSQTVKNSFSFGWEEYLAQEGFVVVAVDGRGTGGRGSEFKKCTYLQMGMLESQDQIEAAQALGQMSFVDKERIGIWGWSFGGYMTLMTLSRGNGTFAAGVAVAPPTDWRLYDSIYTERYMRTPQQNAKGYHDTSVMNHVAGLKGALLIVHGTADDNVHVQSVMQLVPALVEADKDYRMLFYTDKNHSIYGGNTRNHLYRQFTDHFKKHLMR